MESGASASNDLAHRLDRNRRRFFVGRHAEKEALETFITAPVDHPGLVAHICAPGGVGKTTLLKALLQDTRYAHPVLWLDARDVPPNPDILTGLVQALRSRHRVGPRQPHLLIIDTFEHLAPLENWLREEFIPAQPLGFRLILSGRNEPALEWRTDPVWINEHRHLTLPPFNTEEADQYLTVRGVVADRFDKARQFARGNPLALALYTDSIGQHENHAGGLAQSWRQRLVNNLDDPDQRAALEACCVVRQLDEPMLASLLQRNDATDLFNWLASQSYIEAGGIGVFPHDLLRHTFTAELKQRHPSRLTELGDRAFTVIHDRLEHAAENRLGLIQDAFYLLRDIDIQQDMKGSDPAGVYVDSVRPADWPAIDGMIRRFEQDQSVELVHRLHDSQPDSLTVVRDNGDAAIGFFQILQVDQLPQSLLDADPVCARFLSMAREALDHQGTVILNRFWLHQDQDMAATAVYNQAFSQLAFMSVSATPAVMGSAQGDTPQWRQVQERFGHPEASINAPARRGMPVMFIYQDLSADSKAGINWLRRAYRHAHGLAEPVSGSESVARSLPDQHTFQTALRQAFRSATRLDRLQTNALLDCKLLSQYGPNADPVTRAQNLRKRLIDTCERLEAQSTTLDHARVLQTSYLRPAPTQEVAAERLALSYATYRRRLTEALKLVESEWWAEELTLREP